MDQQPAADRLGDRRPSDGVHGAGREAVVRLDGSSSGATRDSPPGTHRRHRPLRVVREYGTVTEDAACGTGEDPRRSGYPSDPITSPCGDRQRWRDRHGRHRGGHRRYDSPDLPGRGRPPRSCGRPHRLVPVHALVAASDRCSERPRLSSLPASSTQAGMKPRAPGTGSSRDDIQGRRPGEADFDLLLRAGTRCAPHQRGGRTYTLLHRGG